MSTNRSALIIDSFPLVDRCYRESLRHSGYENIRTVNSYESLTHDQSAVLRKNKFQLFIVNYGLRSCNDNQPPRTGLCAAQLVRKYAPNIPLFFTIDKLSDHLVTTIIREVNPDALVFRPDLSPVELRHAIERLSAGTPYYSNAVVGCMRRDIAASQFVDRTDRSILYYLAQGARTKDLPRLIALSLPSIEKRKRQLRSLFDNPETDYQLVLAARSHGLI